MRCCAELSHTPGARRAEIAGLLFAMALGIATAAAAHANGPLESAQRQFDAGQYQQAAETLRSALEQNPQDAALHHWLARCYFELRDFSRAVASAERSIKLDPQNSEYHVWLGRAYGRKAEQAGWFSGFALARKTRREFEEAVRLNPANLPAQHDLIEYYLRAPGIVGGGEEKARRQVEALSKVDAVEGHVASGEFWMDRKKPELAEQEYRQVLAANPPRVDPYLEVAEFYLKRRDAARMEEAVEAAIGVDPSDRRLSYYCGVVRVLAGSRLEEAERCLKTYLDMVPQRSDLPTQADAREWLGWLYERQGNCAAAADQYRRTLEMNSHSKSAREALRRVQNCPPGK